MRTAAVCILTTLVVLLGASTAHGQQQAPADTVRVDTAQVDTTRAPIVPIRTAYSERKSGKSPVLAGALGLMVLGGGQLYNGDFGKAMLVYGGVLGGSALVVVSFLDNRCTGEPGFGTGCGDREGRGNDWLGVVGLFVVVGTYAYSIVDAVKSAERSNEIARRRSAQRRLRVAPVYAGGQPGARLTLSF